MTTTNQRGRNLSIITTQFSQGICSRQHSQRGTEGTKETHYTHRGQTPEDSVRMLKSRYLGATEKSVSAQVKCGYDATGIKKMLSELTL